MLNLSYEIVWKFEATTWDSIVASCVHRLDSFDEWLGSCWWLQICHSARGSNPGPAKGKLNQSITNFIEILVNHLLLSFCSHHFSSSRQFLLQGSRSQSHLSAPRYMANSFPLYGLDRMYYDWEAWTKTKRLEHRVALTIFCDPGPILALIRHESSAWTGLKMYIARGIGKIPGRMLYGQQMKNEL